MHLMHLQNVIVNCRLFKRYFNSFTAIAASSVRGSEEVADDQEENSATVDVVYCNVHLLKLLSAHKSHVRETSLFTGAINRSLAAGYSGYSTLERSRPVM